MYTGGREEDCEEAVVSVSNDGTSASGMGSQFKAEKVEDTETGHSSRKSTKIQRV